eukprot:3367237-Prymnesium_polylepis.1
MGARVVPHLHDAGKESTTDRLMRTPAGFVDGRVRPCVDVAGAVHEHRERMRAAEVDADRQLRLLPPAVGVPRDASRGGRRPGCRNGSRPHIHKIRSCSWQLCLCQIHVRFGTALGVPYVVVADGR